MRPPSQEGNSDHPHTGGSSRIREIAERACGAVLMWGDCGEPTLLFVTKEAKFLTAITLTTIALLTLATYWPDPSGGATKPRTVLVADSAKPLPRLPAVAARDCLARPRTCANGANGIVLAYSLKGRVPRTRMLATVLTDVNCEPDRYGISHCLNELRLLGNGRRITVRHDHNMHMYPCLTPGERVRVIALDALR